MTRRERERQRHRQEILDAAAALLADRGPEGLTMDEVARRSEFAVGSVYRHFASKLELVDALVEVHVGPYFAAVERIAAADQPFEASLDAFLAAWLATTRETLPMWRLVLLAREDGRTPVLGRSLDLIVAHLDTLASLIERGQAQGLLVDEDPWMLVAAMQGMLEAYLKRAVFGLDVDLDAAVRVVRRAVLLGFGRERS